MSGGELIVLSRRTHQRRDSASHSTMTDKTATGVVISSTPPTQSPLASDRTTSCCAAVFFKYPIYVLSKSNLVPAEGRRCHAGCGWEGNRRSGSIALAMRYRLEWFVHLRAHGPGKGDEHPAYTPHWVLHTLPSCGEQFGPTGSASLPVNFYRTTG